MKSENQAKILETLKKISASIARQIAAQVSATDIELQINGSQIRAVETGEAQKVRLAIRADITANSDETVDFETWLEIARSEKTVSEKVGQTFDLRQTEMNI